MNQRIPRPIRTALLLALPILPGCAALSQNYGSYDLSSSQIGNTPSLNDTDGTADNFFSGHQPNESKRHADDWVTPAANGSFDAAGDIIEAATSPNPPCR